MHEIHPPPAPPTLRHPLRQRLSSNALRVSSPHFFRLLHFHPPAQRTAKLSLPVIDVALQFHHPDTASFTRHTVTISLHAPSLHSLHHQDRLIPDLWECELCLGAIEAAAAIAAHFGGFFFAVQLLGGLLLLSSYFAPLGLTLLAAELYNILAFHLALALDIAVGVGRVCPLGAGIPSVCFMA
jgi:hypothetical protein